MKHRISAFAGANSLVAAIPCFAQTTKASDYPMHLPVQSVTVGDSGPGPDPEGLERLFGAFYSTKLGGMGMGLAICRSIIHAPGRRIFAATNVPRGAVFRFTLPRLV